MTDLEIARSVPHKHIFEVAQSLGIHSDDLIPFGRYKAKIAPTLGERIQNRPLGRYILVTAINPTPLGEGKTTTSIGLSMGLCRLGHRAAVTLRQPSLGPVFGIKGAVPEAGEPRSTRWKISICILPAMRMPFLRATISFPHLSITICSTEIRSRSIRKGSDGHARLG